MDHPCYKCGHSVEDGKPFCSQCGAPQIRVLLPEAVPQRYGNVSSNDLPIFPRRACNSGCSERFRAFHRDRLAEGSAVLRCCRTDLRSGDVSRPDGSAVGRIGRRISGGQSYRYRNPAWRVNARSGAQLGAVTGVLFFGIAAFSSCCVRAVSHWRGNSPADARRASAGRGPFQ
jgi:hypothetical protein